MFRDHKQGFAYLVAGSAAEQGLQEEGSNHSAPRADPGPMCEMQLTHRSNLDRRPRQGRSLAVPSG